MTLLMLKKPYDFTYVEEDLVEMYIRERLQH